MLVVTRDSGLKRAIKRLTTATGATADFVNDVAAAVQATTRPIDLAVLDVRDGKPDPKLMKALPAKCRVLYIVDEGALIERIGLFEESRTVSLFTYDDRFDDDEFISSATKALRGEVFGLQKYFPWGVTTFTMQVKNYAEKGRAIDVMMAYASTAAVRGPVRDRIQLVADELMMNALYHAPVDSHGKEKYASKSLKELAQLPEVNPIEVQYGCSGRYFGIAVRDGAGSLARARALQYLLRAKTGTTIENKATGAGLGLVSVLSSVSKLVFNLSPGSSTEVIGLFDMELFGKGKVGARSLHLFEAQRRAPSSSDEEPASNTGVRTARAPAGRGLVVVAAVLGAVAAAMGTAVVLKRSEARASAKGPPSLTVVTDPAGAEVRIDGEVVSAGGPTELPAGRDARVTVTADGFAPFARSLSATELGPDTRIYVQLTRAE